MLPVPAGDVLHDWMVALCGQRTQLGEEEGVSHVPLLPLRDSEKLCAALVFLRHTTEAQVARSILAARSGYVTMRRALAGAVDLLAALRPDLAHFVAKDGGLLRHEDAIFTDLEHVRNACALDPKFWKRGFNRFLGACWSCLMTQQSRWESSGSTARTSRNDASSTPANCWFNPPLGDLNVERPLLGPV